MTVATNNGQTNLTSAPTRLALVDSKQGGTLTAQLASFTLIPKASGHPTAPPPRPPSNPSLTPGAILPVSCVGCRALTMGLKQFNLDVKAAASTPCDRVSEIRRGDSDGELVFTYTAQDLAPIEIQALATGTSLFTLEKHAGKDLVTLLDELATNATGKDVPQVIQFISTRLTVKSDLSTTGTSERLQSMDDNDDVDDSENDSGFDADDFSDFSEEYQMELDPLPPRRPASNHNRTVQDHEALKRLKRDLRQANSVGFFVSLLAMNMTDRASGIFSLATRVSKLGIPDEALEAWDLKNSEHVVMLVRIPMGYPSISEFLELPSDQSTIEFRFGKCASPRPSLSTARAAFDRKENSGERDDEYESEDIGPSSDSTGDAFMSLCMSGSLDSLLNREFLGLLLARRRQGISWDQAQTHKFNLSRGDHRRTGSHEVIDPEEASTHDEEPLENASDIKFLQRDFAADSQEDLNIPLVAMQFGLQRLVRCTKYCMYLALGFGQSIEHEIINSPYVVDLLTSFFYSAVTENRLREFPTGLNLKCAYTGGLRDPAKNLNVEVSFKDKTIKFGNCDYISYRTIREGNFVLLVIRDVDPVPSLSIMSGGLERHICIIESVTGETCKFRIIKTLTEPLNIVPPHPATENQSTHPSEGWKNVLLFQYEKDIDDLDATERNTCLMFMTLAIPSVLEMREYLLERPGRLLSSWKRMDASTLALLNWIVASNRSFIIQDDAVPDISIAESMTNNSTGLALSSEDDAVPENSDAASLATHSPTYQPNRVKGMDRTWMQFRFAQGSPEKEQKFIQELDQQRHDNGSQKTFPSLFAWHGSPLGNWHSIIRTGLDFSTSIHGRAYGNGVYFSSDFIVSNGYSGPGSLTTVRLTNNWPNSVLRISSAISICEVINEPEKFISSKPHYVVDKIEWIQCRYLFVRVSPEDAAIALPFLKPLANDSPGYLIQDPARALKGPGLREIEIPLSAIPARRRQTLANNVQVGLNIVQPVEVGLGIDPDEEIKDDIHTLLDSEDESREELTVRQRRRSSEDSGMGVSRPSKLTTAMQESKNACVVQDNASSGDVSMTNFQPGTLDHDSLPRLLEPTWASSSPAALRNLNREIKELQRIQTKSDLRTLGWYVDFDKLSNMFHWIVEMHSFDNDLPLAQDMKRASCPSVVLEFRFGASFPLSPPFVRVVRPRFLPFAQGGGGHVTAGGAICSELLTNSGWSPALSLEKVFLEVRMNLCDIDPPARLDTNSSYGTSDYGIGEALDAFRRAVAGHGWQLPEDFNSMATATWLSS
ncbi:hypothetical protein G7Z17_g9154 [Cylindrodendrum hubeiense]|uniref:UBC core domain-containing protein n=1 Tax=Cylindrodendrum hubeiense TaxID=595255 RepID=A0A9P5LDZ7_9HYPO|nr:hypothetical protein G7Z17_g9154 [Cylindrodendrum hubeiense]